MCFVMSLLIRLLGLVLHPRLFPPAGRPLSLLIGSGLAEDGRTNWPSGIISLATAIITRPRDHEAHPIFLGIAVGYIADLIFFFEVDLRPIAEFSG